MSKLHSIDKPIFRYWQACYMALYSRRLYIDVCKRWRGYGLTYFLLLIVLASIPLSLRIVLNFNQYFKEQLIEPISHLPDIYMQNGQMSLDEPMPYLIRNKHQEVIAVIDAKATAENMFKFYPKLTLLINESKIYLKPPKLELFSQPDKDTKVQDNFFEDSLYKVGDGLFNGQDWVNSSGVLKLKWYTDALVFPAIVIFFFSVYIVCMFGVTLFAQAVSWMIFKLKLKFKETARLCLTAITGQVIIFFLLMAFEIKLPFLGLVQIIVFAFYFSFAALTVKREQKKLVLA